MRIIGDERVYERLSSWWRCHPQALSALLFANTALKYLGYFMYPLLLILDWVVGSEQLVFDIVVPAASFCLVSLVRWQINAQRPYEMYPIDPLIKKDTRGKSFPSRHVFSMFMIALCWLGMSVPVGVVLLVVGGIIAWIRVIGGVHFLGDVLAGALIAVICWACGYCIFMIL
jgi:phosphatidylglycerophosphatase B